MDSIHLKACIASNKDLRDERFAVSIESDINLHAADNPWIFQEVELHSDKNNNARRLQQKYPQSCCYCPLISEQLN